MTSQMPKAAVGGGFRSDRPKWIYLSWFEMLVNLALSCVPRPFTMAMIATAMPAAISPYSMAVAAD